MSTKATMVVIFNSQNSHVLTLSLPTEEVFQVNSQNRPVTNLPVGDFHSQSREMPTFKPLKLNFRFFFWYIVFFPFLESLNFTVSQRYRFFSVLTATIRESSDKLPCIENREGFAVHSSTWQIGYINTREKIRYFFTCIVTAFLRAGNICITPQFTW